MQSPKRLLTRWWWLSSVLYTNNDSLLTLACKLPRNNNRAPLERRQQLRVPQKIDGNANSSCTAPANHASSHHDASIPTTDASSPPTTPTAVLVLARLLCGSSGFINVRAMRTLGTSVSMCTGSTLRAVVYAAEGQWHRVPLPTVVVGGYVGGCLVARHLQYWIEEMVASKVRSTGGGGSSVPASSEPRVAAPSTETTKPLGLTDSSSSKEKVLLARAIATLVLVLFGLADRWKRDILQCVGLQAMAYGLMHTVAQTLCGGTVLFAVTGHYAAMGKAWMEWIHESSSRAQRVLWERTSMIVSFATGIVAAVVFWDQVLPLMGGQLDHEHFLVGVWFTLLFVGYSCWT